MTTKPIYKHLFPPFDKSFSLPRQELLQSEGNPGKETGVGWDPVKKTIDVPDDWWEKNLQEVPEAIKFRTISSAYAMKVEILFRDIIATREGSWAPFIGLVPNDIGGIDAASIMLDEDDNVVEDLDVLDDEPNLNIHGIDNIPAGLDTRDKINKKFGLAVQCKKRRKGVQIVSQHLSSICNVIESKNTMTSKSYDKPGCNTEKVMDVVRGIAERENDNNILKFATKVFLKRSHKEVFVTIKESWLQIDFIKRMGNREINCRSME
ncbi:uncharacterized protein LOC132190758 [Corylus avellana]|uniref:uncharacterized protein LOC132190758 n=1 Tax=Corylus avellana TaxID=13451 RepID=UPI00286BD830|nr:uncharacterized protein LOC132190758 [Corylus avellana]